MAVGVAVKCWPPLGWPVDAFAGGGGRLAATTAGFFATFRPVKDKPSETELFLEQPQGNVVLQKVTGDGSKPTIDAAATATSSLIGVDELLTKITAAPMSGADWAPLVVSPIVMWRRS